MARVAPLNVNYRYVEEELVYLFQNSRARAVVYHAEFAPQVAARARRRCPSLEVLLQVRRRLRATRSCRARSTTRPRSPRRRPRAPAVEHSPDDLYILYTGGTTGMPKGVLWRSADIYKAAMGGRKRDGTRARRRSRSSLEYAKLGADGALGHRARRSCTAPRSGRRSSCSAWAAR